MSAEGSNWCNRCRARAGEVSRSWTTGRHPAKNIQSTEVLREFCTRATFLRSVPARSKTSEGQACHKARFRTCDRTDSTDRSHVLYTYWTIAHWTLNGRRRVKYSTTIVSVSPFSPCCVVESFTRCVVESIHSRSCLGTTLPTSTRIILTQSSLLFTLTTGVSGSGNRSHGFTVDGANTD